MEGDEVYISFNRYGEFIQKGEQRIYLNAEIAPDEMNAEKLTELMNQHTDKPEPVFYWIVQPPIDQHIFSMDGSVGIFKIGNDEKKRNNKNVSLLQEDSIRDVGAPPEFTTEQIFTFAGAAQAYG